jgi:predicted nucleotidyltransferase
VKFPAGPRSNSISVRVRQETARLLNEEALLTVEKLEEIQSSWRPTPEKVDQAVKMAIEIARPSRVFIFGSWARGEATASSDLDLAVFVPDHCKNELGELRKRLRSGLDKIPMSIDLIVASEGYASEFLSSINSVYYKIVRTGRLVDDERCG